MALDKFGELVSKIKIEYSTYFIETFSTLVNVQPNGYAYRVQRKEFDDMIRVAFQDEIAELVLLGFDVTSSDKWTYEKHSYQTPEWWLCIFRTSKLGCDITTKHMIEIFSLLFSLSNNIRYTTDESKRIIATIDFLSAMVVDGINRVSVEDALWRLSDICDTYELYKEIIERTYD